MAYSDGGQRFWQIDLTTAAGARNAAQLGGIAGFIMCGMGVLGVLIFGGMSGFSTPEGIANASGAFAEAAIGLIAGLRLRAEKGVIWGSVAAVLSILEAIGKLMAFSVVGAMLSGGVALQLINGVRGSRALAKGLGASDEAAEAFE